jgi:uncharacterized paraquat-inducible protein A
MRCLNCKYDLRQLTEHRCPECGREFDPNNPNSYDSRPIVDVAGLFLLAVLSTSTCFGTLGWDLSSKLPLTTRNAVFSIIGSGFRALFVTAMAMPIILLLSFLLTRYRAHHK